MLGIENFPVFLFAGIALNLMPGPDTMYILGRSIAQGRRAGVVSVLGIATGTLVHTAAAAFGLSAILVSSALAFRVIKWAGALYLVYLGVQMLRNRAGGTADGELSALGMGAHLDARAIYRQGLLTNVLNPKVALFFMAFLPQFVRPDVAGSPVPFLVLGATFICTGTIWCLILAMAAGTMANRFRSSATAMSRLRALTGALFIGLGVRLAVEEGK